MKNTLLFFSFFLLASCANNSITGTDALSDRTENIGWMHGSCLAIKNHQITPPLEITLVILDDKKTVEKGVIIKRTTSSDECIPLLDDRKDININNGYAFYQVTSNTTPDLAIAYLDIDDLNKLNFQFCTSTEGIHYYVSKDTSIVWEGYYYLGYDSKETCSD